MKKRIKCLTLILSVLCSIIYSCIDYTSITTPNIIYSSNNNVIFNNEYINCSNVSGNNSESIYEIKLLNVFPVKNVKVLNSKKQNVILGGDQFGIKIYSSGCIVTSVSGVLTSEGCINPAYDAGIRKGDIIISINDKEISSNNDVEKIVENSHEKLKIVYERNGKKCTTTAYSVISRADEKRRLGVWIKDSIAGIGTTTFYNPENGITAGLGHGIYDNETNILMPLNDGAVCEVRACGIEKSSSGYIGEIRANLYSDNFGKIIGNNDCGIYFKGDTLEGETIEVADISKVYVGKAKLYLSLNGEEKKYYDCNIKKVDYKSDYKNLIVEITDKELLEKTGGIVQGMSGTPIIQNGRLVGALTHVFVNDPKKGYGVFASTMSAETNELAEKTN